MAWPVSLLFWSLLIPVVLPLGSLALPPYRVVLLITFFPSLFRLLTGKAGRIGVGDIALFLYCCWTCAAFVVADGLAGALQQVGSQALETLGAYLVARAYMRSASDYEALARLLFIIVVPVLLPLAVIEALSGHNFILELAHSVMPSLQIGSDLPRLGLKRVQLVFEHAILFGVFCGAALGMVHLVRGHNQPLLRRLASSGAVLLAVLLSLSSGPISTAMVQVLLLLWNRLMRWLPWRWWLLVGAIAAAVLLVSLVAKRPLPAILFSYFALDAQSANFRLMIWEFGSQSVLNHPLIGVGMGQWDRPAWIGPSIDMFWLANAIRGGLPAAAFILIAFFANTLSVIFVKGLDARSDACRLAFVLSMIGFFLVGWMVFFWGTAFVLFMFLLGSASWMRDSQTAPLRRSQQFRPTVSGRVARPAGVSRAHINPVDPGTQQQ